MSTFIHVSKKLETLIKKHITSFRETENIGILGKWNATVFYVNRTKNWLLYNPKTHYSLILENITAKDLPNIKEKIAQEFHIQLAVDRINSTQLQVNWLLDEISFLPTDADRSALSYINQILLTIECHLSGEHYPSLAQINTYLNDSIFSLDGPSKYTRITTPRKEMAKILALYLAIDQDKPTDERLMN
jgi:hypothetical protein